MDITTIAILGLGAMGSRMATHLIAAGYEVTVWNRSPGMAKTLMAQGATVAASPQLAAMAATVIISMVTDNNASREVWLNPETGAILGLQPGAIAIECSTLTVKWTQHLASALEARGVQFLDAPVVGSRPQAEAGQLISLVGGNAETLAHVEPILGVISGAIHHVGTIGQGTAMKLAVNTLFGVQVATLAEMLALLAKQGISPNQAMACLGELPITSAAVQGAGRLMVSHQHDPLFPIALVEKDFRYVLAMAQAVKAKTPTAVATQQIYQDAIAAGYGNDNITGVIQYFG